MRNALVIGLIDTDNPGQNICDTSNYLTQFRIIIASWKNLPLTPTIQC
jgi:hypothetical protein